MKADLHIHTNFSPCSKSNVIDVIETAQRRGLDVIAITDHGTIKGAVNAKKINPYSDLKIIIGCEVHCEYGELLIYELKNEIKSRKFTQILKEVRKQKAKIFIAHPIDYVRFNNSWKKLSDNVLNSVDGVEVYNGRNVFNFLVKNLQKNKSLRGIAGSDSHVINEIGNTYVKFKSNLWKEVQNSKISFYHNHSFFSKLISLIKGFLTKRIN